MTEKILVHLLYSGQGGLGTYFTNFVQADTKQLFKHVAIFYGVEPLYEEYKMFCEVQHIDCFYFKKEKKLDFRNWLRVRNLLVKYKSKKSLLLFHTLSLTPIAWITRGFKNIALDHTTADMKTKIEWFYVWYHFHFSKVVCFYDSQIKSLKKRLPLLKPLKHVSVIPKNVNTNFFCPPKEENRKNVVIGMAARITEGKRQDLLVKLASKLKSAGIPWKVKVAGIGLQLKNLQQKVYENDLHDYIEFVGLLNRNALLKFYQSMTAYIHASDGETVCYSIMEAQACGLPIFASNVEGINHVIQHQENGFLFENNVDSMFECLYENIQPVLLTQMGKKSREIAVENTEKHNNPAMLFDLIKS